MNDKAGPLLAGLFCLHHFISMHSLMQSKVRASLGVVIVAFMVSGCYTFRPVTAPRVSERVRLTLTSQGTEELARFLGPRVVGAEGDLTAIRNDGSMIVAVDFVQLADGIRQPWTGEGVVTFPAGYVTEVRERTFLRRQSYVAGTALTGGLIAVAIFALRGGRSEGGGGGGPPPPPP